MTWLLPNDKVRIIWAALFGFGISLFLILSAFGGMVFILPALLFVTCLLAMVATSRLQIPLQLPTIEKRIFVLPDKRKYGIVYIMRRADGVLKFGKTHSLRARIRGHRNDYKMGFSIVASWVVPNTTKYEALIMRMTQGYIYPEKGRRELRQMSNSELDRLILNFTEELYKGWQ